MFDKLLSKILLHITLRVLSWISRFLSKSRKHRVKSPLTTNELWKRRKLIVRKVQLYLNVNKKQSNMKVREEGLYQCFDRIQGEYAIFIPKESILAKKLVDEAHILTIHGGVRLTMAKIRSEYWMPSLRQLVMKTIRKFYGWKGFQVSHYPEPSTRFLPAKRTTQNLPFKVISIDYYAGLLICKIKGSKETKVYISLFTCCFIRATHLTI